MTEAIAAIEARALGKRYGRQWALQDCALALPRGRVAGLVGPNGAGKTTLLHLAAGLLRPSSGQITVLGAAPGGAEALARVGFVAQDKPLYRSFRVAEMLRFGARLNPSWDNALAESWLGRLGIPLDQRVGRLSGGHQAQVALVMALGKRPELMLLDEPFASLDPLARRQFLQILMEEVTDTGATVLLSSHLVADLDRVCDYLILLSSSHVQLSAETETLLGTHKLLTGPADRVSSIANGHAIVHASQAGRQATLVARLHGAVLDPAWTVTDIGLEELVLAYLRRSLPASSVPLRATEPPGVPA